MDYLCIKMELYFDAFFVFGLMLAQGIVCVVCMATEG
jgi:hypothetical protein